METKLFQRPRAVTASCSLTVLREDLPVRASTKRLDPSLGTAAASLPLGRPPRARRLVIGLARLLYRARWQPFLGAA